MPGGIILSSSGNSAALALKADIASPALTGTPTTPTPVSDSGIANKGYVDQAITTASPRYTSIVRGSTSALTGTTLTADSVLKVALAANEKVLLSVYLEFSGNADNDFKCQLNAPNGCKVNGEAACHGNAVTGELGTARNVYTIAGTSAGSTVGSVVVAGIPAAANTAGTGHLTIDVLVQNGSTAGDLTITMARNSNTQAVDTVLAAESWLVASAF